MLTSSTIGVQSWVGAKLLARNQARISLRRMKSQQGWFMRIVMGVMLPVNIALNYGFMFGQFGIEPLGAPGCGLGNAFAFWMMLGLLAWHTVRAAPYQPLALWQCWEWPPMRRTAFRFRTTKLQLHPAWLEECRWALLLIT